MGSALGGARDAEPVLPRPDACPVLLRIGNPVACDVADVLVRACICLLRKTLYSVNKQVSAGALRVPGARDAFSAPHMTRSREGVTWELSVGKICTVL